jgi:hypothetical protein
LEIEQSVHNNNAKAFQIKGESFLLTNSNEKSKESKEHHENKSKNGENVKIKTVFFTDRSKKSIG